MKCHLKSGLQDTTATLNKVMGEMTQSAIYVDLQTSVCYIEIYKSDIIYQWLPTVCLYLHN